MSALLPSQPAALTGVQRAAVLMIALGVETASKLLPTLDDEEVERVSVEVARLQRVPGNLVTSVLGTYQASLTEAPPPEAEGGLATARTFLREGLDEDRVGAILPRVEAATEGTGFDLLQSVPAEELAAFLAAEHPQTAAVVLSRLAARKAGDTLGHLPTEIRGDVIRRLSTLTPPPASALAPLDTALRRRFGPGARAGGSNDGVKRAADILTQSGRATGRSVLDHLQTHTPDLASQIEGLLFVFEDLEGLDNRDLARVLAESDQGALAVALTGCEQSLADRMFGCVSERVSAALREEMEMVGAPTEAEIEEAQRAVVGAVLGLAESGQIDLTKSTPVAA